MEGVRLASRSKDGPNGADQLPFRLGKVQAEDLQVSVREVGVVEPETKVDVKSAVSGRVVAMKVRDGAVVKAGRRPGGGRARRDPGPVAVGLCQRGRHAGRGVAQGRRAPARLPAAALRRGPHRERDAEATSWPERDLAAESLKAARKRYEIVEDHGIPISSRQRGPAGPGHRSHGRRRHHQGRRARETVTSGVSSFNAGTVLFTVADLRTLLIKVNLNEVDIAKVKVGQPVRITLDAYPQKTFTGKVRFVAPAAKLHGEDQGLPDRDSTRRARRRLPHGHERERGDAGGEEGQGGLVPWRRSSAGTAVTVVYRLKGSASRPG